HTFPYHITTLSLHDALPISVPVPSTQLPSQQVQSQSTPSVQVPAVPSSKVPSQGKGSSRTPSSQERNAAGANPGRSSRKAEKPLDRKSTRLNSSHDQISYAV